jgi:acetyltransferase-like isoleucine patch superfamily enzyme
MISSILRYIAFRSGRFRGLYVRFCKPNAEEYTRFLKLHGGFYAIGDHCSILPSTNITDPAYVKLGNNVHFSNCTLIGHDGSIAMMNRAYNVALDSVGRIEILDNVFVGYGAIVLPNITIGPDAIVAAGSVVTRNVAPGVIVAGVPARPIGKVKDLVAKLETETASLPWNDLIQQRGLDRGLEMEEELVRQRVKFFFSQDQQ